ncbi:Golgi nucleoside diphosphatase [Encephalitozoon hellem ATCC 50504]|uniref:Nod factor binding lectin-nucleotide phosphohydrolase n=1 Tax=Encephalitozoon hellem TaxID=27973 RepID=A0A9Q9F8G2_ENCHE|nr:Golgi nucleoside diphosphatase [Encephalitozoon hellem ATCC 50504]AFM98650.1 Golgi nucleoside diphosphatase [Encephalitozoon hellem ATCC 50504]UTX43599.1 nod factor binding lectin-nucleotide phosphohydrolase [Encephalitozoon hellem]WEL39074.1 nod factor binding lectin-nucleotide phosphohydrolase [Encephalitozoon hellem]|eukprot:XP_003887631.1 Golgi nucleoside diphosphatase [Encephalitozoon hellem ATCC 50504]
MSAARLFLLAGIASALPSSLGPDAHSLVKMTYSGVIDAGTTGTRLNIYGFLNGEIRDQGLFTNTFGLANAESDEEIRNSIRELFTHAQPFYTNIKEIPIGFYGTAGFRVLDKSRSDHILELVKNELRDYNLKEAEVISGIDEGKLALMALALSNRGIVGSKSMGIIDMGGGSTQISLLEKNGEIFSESIDLGITALGLSDPKECKGKENDEQESCARNIMSRLIGITMRPSLNSIDELYLLSYFHDEFGKVTRNEKTNMKEIKGEFYKKCSLLESHECRRLFYLISFIKNLGIEDTKFIHQIDTNNGINIAWASGKGYELNKKYN